MKEKKPLKLRYHMWLYFIIFAVLIIAIIWIFQIVMFDKIYQNSKNEALVSTGENIAEKLEKKSGASEVLKAAVDANESGIFCYLAYFGENKEISYASIYSEYIGSETDAPDEELLLLLQDAMTSFEAKRTDADPTKDYLSYRYESSVGEVSYVYVTMVQSPEGKDCYLVLESSSNSLVATVRVIQLQLLIVTAVVTVVAFFLSWYISVRLSRPITEMSQTAEKWAAGDETAVFRGDSYEELMELADAMNIAKDEASQTKVLQRDLLANVSHDLKTPLTMIKAYAEMIRDLSGDIKEKREMHTKVIIDEADRLTMLVNDILDLSKLQNGINQPEISCVNVSELCETVINQFNDFAESNGYTIEREIEADLFVDCDENKIKQVFYNLIGNSINYTGDDKKILVRLTRSGGKVLFESIDSGKGISQDKVDEIWEKYYRFSETHQRPIKGTGLGLSIVKTILEAHKLKFGVISKKDVGSNFFIEFRESGG